MSQIEVRIITNIIEIFFVTYSLSIFQNKKYKVRDFLESSLIYLPSFFISENSEWRLYVIKHIYLIFVFVIYLMKNKGKISIYLPHICVLLSISGILKVPIGVMGALTASFFKIENIAEETRIGIATIIYLLIFVRFIIGTIKLQFIKFDFSFSKKCIAYFIYGFIVCIKIPFLYTEIRDALALKMVVLTILCCTVIFLIISGIDKHNAQKERERIEENNKKLSSRLHKSQEILPAMVQVLSHVTENGGTEMETQKAQELLAEVNDLYGRQLRENSEEDLQLKNFCSTGLKMLDQQLKVYQMEAIDRNVNLDIFVQAPINDLIKKDGIDQWRLQRAVGDLVRNAFRAVEKEDKKCRANKHILLIIGCRYEGILEVAVVDNGTEFPLHVIEAFGKRGVTTGGTGNGLADLVEFADDMGASISVDEFDGRTSLFTKRVSISFDKQRKNNFNSVRKEFVGGSFWNIW